MGSRPVCSRCQGQFGSVFAVVEHQRTCDGTVPKEPFVPKNRKKKPKTVGLEWLYYSVNAFNGTKYADHSSALNFYHSYVERKASQGKMDVVEFAVENKKYVIQWAERFVGRGRRPLPWEVE